MFSAAENWSIHLACDCILRQGLHRDEDGKTRRLGYLICMSYVRRANNTQGQGQPCEKQWEGGCLQAQGGDLKRSRPTVPCLGLLDSDSARAEVILLEIVSLSFGSPWRWTWGLKNVSNVGIAHKKLRLTLTCLRCVPGKWVSVTTKIKGGSYGFK